MTVKNLYTRGLLFPALVAVLSTSILSLFDTRDYKSDWLTKESIVLMAVLTSCVYSAIVCTLALTIFLNDILIKTGRLAIFLSWFLLPMGWIIIAVYKTTYDRLTYQGGTTVQFMYLITLNLPFVVGLVWTYVLFIKKRI